MILPLSDILRILRRMPLLFVGIGIALGSMLLIYLTLCPVHFTAKGILKSSKEANTPFLKALELLSKEEDGVSPPSDIRPFLRSQPVLERTVRTLNLQATLMQPHWGEWLRERWYTVKTERAYVYLKRHPICSHVLAPSVNAPRERV
ncbi:MAG: hypothetical protein HY324_04040, partial [Chlamydiia bacterium]|nr:hypothetical protein [Chlamydiia bacterium]